MPVRNCYTVRFSHTSTHLCADVEVIASTKAEARAKVGQSLGDSWLHVSTAETVDERTRIGNTPDDSWLHVATSAADTEEIADILCTLGYDASAWDSGGNIECVLIRAADCVYLFGTANETWAGDVYPSMEAFENGEQPTRSVETQCDSDEEDADEVAAVIAQSLGGSK